MPLADAVAARPAAQARPPRSSTGSPDLGAQIGSPTGGAAPRPAPPCAPRPGRCRLASHRPIIGAVPAPLDRRRVGRGARAGDRAARLGGDYRRGTWRRPTSSRRSPKRPSGRSIELHRDARPRATASPACCNAPASSRTEAHERGRSWSPSAVPLADIKPGTRIDLTLGRRPNKTVARPLEQLAFRARFDLGADGRARRRRADARSPGDRDRSHAAAHPGPGRRRACTARRAPPACPPRAVETYIKAIATQHADRPGRPRATRFDIVDRARKRAATGETQLGNLLFAGLDQGRRKLQLVKWTDGDHGTRHRARPSTRATWAMPVPGADHLDLRHAHAPAARLHADAQGGRHRRAMGHAGPRRDRRRRSSSPGAAAAMAISSSSRMAARSAPATAI